MIDDNAAALLIAGISLGLAGTTFAWQVIDALWIDAPRLKVRVMSINIFGTSSLRPSKQEAIQVAVVNHGKRGTRLSSVWLQIGKPPSRLRLLLPRAIRNKRQEALIMPGDITNEPLAAYNTPLPTDLPPGGVATVFYDPKGVRRALSETSDTHVYGTANATTARARSRAFRFLNLEGRVLGKEG